VQDPALALVEPHQVPLCPALQPVQVSLDGSTACRCVHCSSQFGVISRLAEGSGEADATCAALQHGSTGGFQGRHQSRCWWTRCSDRCFAVVAVLPRGDTTGGFASNFVPELPNLSPALTWCLALGLGCGLLGADRRAPAPVPAVPPLLTSPPPQLGGTSGCWVSFSICPVEVPSCVF